MSNGMSTWWSSTKIACMVRVTIFFSTMLLDVESWFIADGISTVSQSEIFPNIPVLLYRGVH